MDAATRVNRGNPPRLRVLERQFKHIRVSERGRPQLRGEADMTKRRALFSGAFTSFAQTIGAFGIARGATAEPSTHGSYAKREPIFLTDFLPNFSGKYVILPLSGMRWRVHAVEAVIKGVDNTTCRLTFCVEDVNGVGRPFAELFVKTGVCSKELIENKPVIEPIGISSRSLSAVVSAEVGKGDIYLAVSGSNI